MTFVVRPDDLGTPETEWLGSGALDDLPVWAVPPVTEVVVVAPHPDDEVLGTGGLLQQLSAQGIPVDVLAVTDGETSHPRSPTVTPGRLASIRNEETALALRRLHIGPRQRTRLQLPDGGVEGGEQAIVDALSSTTGPGTLVLAPWAGDGHPDHDAAGRAARRAVARSGAHLAEYLVWAWHWATPESGALPLERAVRVDLDRRTRATKRWATCAYTSQIRALGPQQGDEVVLPAPVLRRAWRPFEVYLMWSGHG